MWVLHHEGDVLAEDLVLEAVDDVVLLLDGARFCGVAAGVGLEGVVEHAHGRVRHHLERDGLAWGLLAVGAFPSQDLLDLGDVVAVTPDAVEVRDDLQARADGAQVLRHGLVERQKVERVPLELDVEPVERFAAPHHARGELGVIVDERLDAVEQALAGFLAHLQHPLAQGLDLFMELFRHSCVLQRLGINRTSRSRSLPCACSSGSRRWSSWDRTRRVPRGRRRRSGPTRGPPVACCA